MSTKHRYIFKGSRLPVSCAGKRLQPGSKGNQVINKFFKSQSTDQSDLQMVIITGSTILRTVLSFEQLKIKQ